MGTPDVSAAEAALGQAKVATLAARDTLERTKYQAKIGGFTEKPLEDAENALVTANSTLSQAKSDLAQAQRDCDRKAKLFEIGVGSKSDLDVALNTLEKARENAKADEESVRIAKQAFTREQKASQSNLYADNQVKQMESAYRQAVLQEAAAEKSLRLAKASIFRDLEQAKSDYQSAKYDFQNSQKALTLLGKPSKDGELSITSPISGVITERNVNQGQIVDQSQMTPWQMFTVSNSKKIWVSMDIYEKDISSVKDGASLSIRVGAVPNREFSGKIFRISPTIDSKSRTVKVQAEIPNPNGLLKDGEFAEVTVLLGIGHQGIAIPISAIVRDGESDIVFVFDGKNYIKRTVRLSGQQGDRYQISDGLRVGDRVVTKGAIFLGTQANGG